MAEVVSRRSIIYDILFNTKKGTAQVKTADTAVKKLDKSTSSFSNTLKGVGAAIAAAFAVRELARFAKESIKLAAAAESISIAFKRLNQPNLLKDLRGAVKGTIDDVELMRQSVRAKNFKIPLTDLAKFFEFAATRARETGESVDFLVNSIISGIGRKSPLILDNLGISAVELRKKLKGVGTESATVADVSRAMAEIIDEEFVPAVESSADRLAQMDVAITNLKLSLGRALLPLISGLAGDMAKLFGSTQSATDAFKTHDKFLKKVEERLPKLTKEYVELSSKTDLNKDEQEKLEDVIEQIITIVPQAATEFDEYGKALGISTEAIEEFTRKQVLLNETLNRKAIDEQKEALSEANKQVEIYQNTLNGVAGGLLSIVKINGVFKEVSVAAGKAGVQQFRDLTEAEVNALRATLARHKAQAEGSQLVIDSLRGIKIEEEKSEKAIIDTTETIGKLGIQIKDLKQKIDDADISTEKGRASIKGYQDEIFLLEQFIKNLLNTSKPLEETLTFDIKLDDEELNEAEIIFRALLDRQQLSLEEALFKQEISQQKFNEKSKALTTDLLEFNIAATKRGTQERIDAERLLLEFQKASALKQQELQQAQVTATVDSFSSLAGAIAQITQFSVESSKASALVSIITSQAAAIANGIEQAQKLPPPANFAASAAVLASVVTLFAQVRSVFKESESVPIPQFAEGTEFLQLNGSKKGTDTIPIWADEGEAIIKSDSNKAYPGLAKAFIDQNVEDWIGLNYQAPIFERGMNDESDVIDYSGRFYRQWTATKDGNQMSKNMIRVLNSIDGKIGNAYFDNRYAS